MNETLRNMTPEQRKEFRKIQKKIMAALADLMCDEEFKMRLDQEDECTSQETL